MDKNSIPDTEVKPQDEKSLAHAREALEEKTTQILYDGIHWTAFSWAMAARIGKNETLLLQEIHYWCTLNHDGAHYKKGKYWVWNSIEQWVEHFEGVLPVRTIERTFASLKKQSLIHAEPLSSNQSNRTNWYSINHDTVRPMMVELIEEQEEKLRKAREKRRGIIQEPCSSPHEYSYRQNGGVIPPKWREGYSETPSQENPSSFLKVNKKVDESQSSNTVEDPKEGGGGLSVQKGREETPLKLTGISLNRFEQGSDAKNRKRAKDCCKELLNEGFFDDHEAKAAVYEFAYEGTLWNDTMPNDIRKQVLARSKPWDAQGSKRKEEEELLRRKSLIQQQKDRESAELIREQALPKDIKRGKTFKELFIEHKEAIEKKLTRDAWNTWFRPIFEGEPLPGFSHICIMDSFKGILESISPEATKEYSNKYPKISDNGTRNIIQGGR